MKEIKQAITSYKTIYEAIDGTQFSDKNECEKYEASAAGVLMTRLQKYCTEKYNAFDMFGSSDESAIIGVNVENQHVADMIKQLYYIENKYLLNPDNQKRKDAIDTIIDNTIGKMLLIEMNIDNDWFIIDSRENIIDKLNNMR